MKYTNFEMIKAMNVGELAQFIDDIQREECIAEHAIGDDGKIIHESLVTGWENWLSAEAKMD